MKFYSFTIMYLGVFFFVLTLVEFTEFLNMIAYINTRICSHFLFNLFSVPLSTSFPLELQLEIHKTSSLFSHAAFCSHVSSVSFICLTVFQKRSLMILRFLKSIGQLFRCDWCFFTVRFTLYIFGRKTKETIFYSVKVYHIENI